VSVNLAGLPGISIPCGFVEQERHERSERSERLPIGFQLIGRMFDEATILRVADVYERATDWHGQRPM
jgi:aspartyl-tRNA(Asn)/glutamyl-tRNA(Gln) amidotransferase subunit A